MTKHTLNPEQRAKVRARIAANKAASLARDEAEAAEAAKAAEAAEAAEQAPVAPQLEPADAEADVGDDDVGYKKPPRRHRFKKGQSGCPDGGWPQRIANAAAKRKAEALKKREKTIAEEVAELFKRKVPISINGEATEVSALTALIYRDQLDAETDAKTRERQIRRAERLGLLTSVPTQAQIGVVVVSAPLSKEEWLAKGRATKLPMDPLEGLPGIPKNIDRTKGRSAETLDNDQGKLS